MQTRRSYSVAGLTKSICSNFAGNGAGWYNILTILVFLRVDPAYFRKPQRSRNLTAKGVTGREPKPNIQNKGALATWDET